MASRRFCKIWKRSATCRACGAPSRAPWANEPQRSRLIISMSGCRLSQSAVAPAERSGKRSITCRRSKSTMMVHKWSPCAMPNHRHPALERRFDVARLCLPFEAAQDCIIAGRHADPLHQPFTWPAADAVAKEMNEFGRPTSAARQRRRYLGNCSAKVCRLQALKRHCQRWIRSFTVTPAPCAGRSCRWRSCQPCRCNDCVPQSGHTPNPSPTAEIIHWPWPCSALKIRAPRPGDHPDFLFTVSSYSLIPCNQGRNRV